MDTMDRNPSVPSTYLDYRTRYRKTENPTKIRIFAESLKTIAKEYCAESSLGGLKHLVNDKTSLVERIIWVITLALAIVCSGILVQVTFSNFFKAPLVTKQLPEGVAVSKILFPAVGICTNNRISKRAVTKLAKELVKAPRNRMYNESDIIGFLFGLRQLYDFHPKTNQVLDPLVIHRILGKYDANELLKSLTPPCEDILLMCAWDETPANCSSLFDFRLTANGYCCTFNYLRQSDMFEEGKASLDMYNYGNKSLFGYDRGLKVLLKQDQTDDFYYNVPTRGAQLQFSDAYDFPDAPSGSFALQLINTNVQMTVMIEATFTEASRSIQHVAVTMRQCLFYDESPYLPFYTSSDCMLKCRLLFLLDKCNCIPFNMPKMKNKRTCDMRDVNCLRFYYAPSITPRPNVETSYVIPDELELDMANGGMDCPMCYPSCSKTAYKFDFINIEIFPEKLNQVPDIYRMDWLRGMNFTGTSIVHLKYAREYADCYEQDVIMQWFDLISEIGSTCGFVTGFSFASLLEFFYFFVVKLYREIRGRQNKNQSVNAIEYSTPSHTDPVATTKYRPVYWKELAGPTMAWNTPTRRPKGIQFIQQGKLFDKD